MQVQEIVKLLEDWAPPALQESYDNSGLLTGLPNMEVKGVLITLDITEEVLDEAVRKSCNMVIAHNPMIFGGIKRLNGSNYTERCIIKAIKNDLAVYAIHTNLDSVETGVSKALADRMGLRNTRTLKPRKATLQKLYTFAPKEAADRVRQALFDAGAGHIGQYDHCSFNSEGTGTFRALEGSHPYVGEVGKEHHEAEIKIEVIFPKWLQSKVVRALLDKHPYEEVAYDIVNLENENSRIGFGMIGDLDRKMDPEGFLKTLKERLELDVVRYTPYNLEISKVAVCGGSGSFLLEKAKQAGADAMVSADFKYHQFFDADSNIMICDIGHYESERFAMQLIYDKIRNKFPNFALHLTSLNSNPIKYYY